MSVTTASVGENGKHRVEVESLDDDLQGDDITIHYEQGTTVIDGDTVTGVQKGSTMQFNVDFESKQIDPGIWAVTFTRDDGGTTRQVGVEGEGDNNFHVQVTDSQSI